MVLSSNSVLKSLLISSFLIAMLPAANSNASDKSNRSSQSQETTKNKGKSSIPPFQGTRGFDFWDTRGSERFIEINSKGYTTIKQYDVYGDGSPTIYYKGKYTNPIVTSDGEIYKLSKGKIYLIDSKGKTKSGCNYNRTERIEPCVSELHK